MKGYCEKCRDTNDFNVKMVDKEKTIKGRLIKYVGQVAYCQECREEVFSPEIRDYNLNELEAAYREEENLL